jgi:hypothetical protein
MRVSPEERPAGSAPAGLALAYSDSRNAITWFFFEVVRFW